MCHGMCVCVCVLGVGVGLTLCQSPDADLSYMLSVLYNGVSISTCTGNAEFRWPGTKSTQPNATY